MRRSSTERGGQGVVLMFVIFTIMLALIYALSQGQAGSEALTGTLRAAGLRAILCAGRSALNEADHKLRNPLEGAPEPLDVTLKGGTAPAIEPLATRALYEREIQRGELVIDAVEVRRVTPARGETSTEPWLLDLVVRVQFRLGGVKLARTLRRRFVGHAEFVTMELPATNEIVHATLVLNDHPAFEVVEE